MKRLILGLVVLTNACAYNSDNVRQNPEPAQVYVVNVDEQVAGKYLHEYANMWWQWTRTMSQSESPVADRTGAKCHVNQAGDVWFLAGGYGTSTISRRCSIPEGKYIFFPVINTVIWPREGSELTCENAKARASLNNDHLLIIDVDINGQNIPEARQYRVRSHECFDLLGMISEKDNAPVVYPAATDGYWIMLNPLPKGNHTIKFSAQYNRPGTQFGEMAQDIEYEIRIR